MSRKPKNKIYSVPMEAEREILNFIHDCSYAETPHIKRFCKIKNVCKESVMRKVLSNIQKKDYIQVEKKFTGSGAAYGYFSTEKTYPRIKELDELIKIKKNNAVKAEMYGTIQLEYHDLQMYYDKHYVYQPLSDLSKVYIDKDLRGFRKATIFTKSFNNNGEVFIKWDEHVDVAEGSWNLHEVNFFKGICKIAFFPDDIKRIGKKADFGIR